MNGISNIYLQLDGVVGSTGSVLFGSGALAGLPVSELVHFFGLNLSVCNRSMKDISPREAQSHLEECVFMLDPEKVFLGFGEELLESGGDIEGFIADYEALIDRIVTRCDASVYILSALSAEPEAAALNARLARLAQDCGCSFIDVSDCMACDHSMLRLFRRLSHHIRSSHINFTDAMNIASRMV